MKVEPGDREVETPDRLSEEIENNAYRRNSSRIIRFFSPRRPSFCSEMTVTPDHEYCMYEKM